ncbi:MAG: twin-arginine translocase TatA/TatE family subunit [Candidatus Methanoperedens sp.]|nr:twin-arginine translocase TatA/TatE family subunit [Candidatus Methanoperedens sp.]MCZ7360390.1 twin-arginine translocase TatA/TatE family subunit [Candidatus Methanoperedens sp.]HLB70607.1 twin-arginine translocase TatA/TatE family subunit [Candidatus Methanoperedens sp.]
MAIGPTEIILIVVVIIFLFGASKIPELARSLGRATGEFKKAKDETERELRDVEKSLKEGRPVEEKSSKIKEMARDLGIKVEGKSDEQLLDEIKKKMPSVVKYDT